MLAHTAPGPLSRCRRFFFSEEIPYGMALIRLTLPLVLFVDMLPRWLRIRELYSADGAPTPLADNFGFPGLIPEIPGTAAVALGTALMVLLLTSAAGWFSRLSLFGAAVLYSYFGLMDSISTITKYTVISTHALLLLSLSGCGRVWSIDAWLARGRADGEPPRTAPIWPQRLLQILLGMIYFGAAITKLHTPAFLGGEQLEFWLITHLYLHQHFGDLLWEHPLWIILGGYATLLWELTFMFCVWRPTGKVLVLALGALFHIGTGMTLGLFYFPLIMILLYACFMTQADAERLGAVLTGWSKRWMPLANRFRVPPALALSPAGDLLAVKAGLAFVIMLCGSVFAGIEWEHRRDPYGLRRAEEPHVLREIPEDEARRLLVEDDTLREKDKFLGFDVGTESFGGRLWNRRTEFAHGEQAVLQVSMSPPHGDLWVECNLHDAQDRVIERNGQVITRESFRGLFSYNLGAALEPGEYSFVLRSGGQFISRRKISLRPAMHSPVAN